MTKKRFSRVALAVCLVRCVTAVLLTTPEASKPHAAPSARAAPAALPKPRRRSPLRRW